MPVEPQQSSIYGGGASSTSLASVVNSITTANTLPFRTNVVGLSLAVLHFVAIGVAAILVISSIASPTWVTSGWDDVFSNATSPPIMWSPFSFCHGGGCRTLPNRQYFGSFVCTSGASGPTDDSVGSRLRVSQAFSVLGLLALIAATGLAYCLIDGIVLSKRALNLVDATFGELLLLQQQQEQRTLAAEEVNTSDSFRQRRRGDSGRRRHEPHNAVDDDEETTEVEVVYARAAPTLSLPPVRVDVVARTIVRSRVEPLLRALDRLCTPQLFPSATVNGTSDAADAIVQEALRALRHTRQQHGHAPLVELQRLRLWWALGTGALLVSTVCLGIGLGVFDTLERSTLNCGAPYCDILMAAAGGPCGRGAAYRAFLAGTILSGIAFLVSIVLCLLYRRPAKMSLQFLRNFVSVLQDEILEAEEAVHALRMRFSKGKAATSTSHRASAAASTTTTRQVREDEARGMRRQMRDDGSPPQQQQQSQPAVAPSDSDRSLASKRLEPHISGRPSPQPQVSVGGVLMDYRSSAPTEPGWVFDEQEKLFYCASRKMYYDPRSAQYYDPKSGQWWNGSQWYRVTK